MTSWLYRNTSRFRCMGETTCSHNGLRRCSKWSMRQIGMDSFVDEVLPHYDGDTILLDMIGWRGRRNGAVKQPPKAVVLTGTSLGNWWFWTLSAAPILNRFFTIPSREISLSDSGAVKIGSTVCQSASFSWPFKDDDINLKPPNDLVSKLKRSVLYTSFGDGKSLSWVLAKSLSRKSTSILERRWTLLHVDPLRNVSRVMHEIERRLDQHSKRL